MIQRFFAKLVLPSLYLILCATGISMLAVPARANIQPLTLTNASFETHNPFDQNINNGCGTPTPCYNLSIVDWNQFNPGPSAASGTFAPDLCGGAASCLPLAYTGNNVAFLNSSSNSGSYITQDLGTLIGGDIYSVSVEVASRATIFPAEALYRLGVATGGTPSAPTFATYYQTPTGTASYGWSVATLQFTPASTADWYVFVSNDGGAGGAASELLLDATTPEPSALLPLFIIVAGLALFRKKFVADSDRARLE